MVVNAPETPIQAEVIFVVEATAANGAYINELKTNYIIPTLEYFHGGALEEGGGSGSVYSIVAYKAADCHPGLPVSTYGPFNCPQNVIDTIDKIQYIGGHAESRACVTEALVTVLACCEELGRTDIPIHVLLVCCSPPYSTYAGGLAPIGVACTVESAARVAGERGANVSVLAARRLPALAALYELAGGDLHTAHQRNYAKDPRHMVLLRGYSLKERPPSPAPPPVPDIQQPDVYGARCGAGAAGPRAAAPYPRGAPAWPNRLAPPRQNIYPPNSALLTQLAQPSYPPPPTQRLPSMLPGAGAGPSGSGGAGAGVGVGVGPGAGAAPLQQTYIWSGVLEWMEKGKAPGDQQKVTKLLPCQVSANSKNIEPELKVDTWPNKLLMQLMPKQLISNIGGQYLKDSKSVLFHLHPNEALDALTKVMANGFAGCVHFSSPPQCDIKVLILLYTPDKKAYLGFIPNNQVTFVDRLRKVIQQQKITQIINKMPAGATPTMANTMPTNTITGTGAMQNPGMSQGGMGTSGMGGGMGSGMGQVSQMGQLPAAPQSVGNVPGTSAPMGQGQVQHNPQGMMMGGNMGVGVGVGGGGMGGGVGGGGMGGGVGGGGMGGGVGGGGMGGGVGGGGMGGGVGGGRGGAQLDGLEAARQQNLEKIQHLQQTLEAAHQQEAQFKSQMDIMSHLHAAQQQELNYKQMEEQRKHQLQQQLQQQLRAGGVGGVGVGGVGVGGGAHPRLMGRMLPANPGLRHLLQQQPQYRPGGGAPRPSAPGQQFDDVNNYDFL